MISGPVPGSANIFGRGSQVYTWTYRAAGIGKIELSGSASGIDVVSGRTVTSIIHKNVSVALREGGVSISVLPRSNTILNGISNILNIEAKNTENVDDVFKIQINVSELPLSYQADPGWFNWTEQIVFLRAGQEIIAPINITIPDTISGTKMFHAKVSQETSGIYAYDTGYLKIIPLREGGVSISVLPRTNTILNGTSIILDINAKNTQNVDDVFKILINASELPLSYQADPGWFNWTEQIVYLRAGQEIIAPINITIPDTVSGTKMFRAKVSQETSGIYAYDTGYLKII